MSRLTWEAGSSTRFATAFTERFYRIPRPPDPFVHCLRSLSASVLRSWLRTYHRLEIVGQENLPTTGESFVIVANHSSHLDALCLLSALPRDLLDCAYPVAAEDYFFSSMPRIAASAIFINAIPFGRRAHVRQSMDRCRRLLRGRGNVLILFPEGTRSVDGLLATFRPGVGNLLAGLDVPAVPCAIIGAHRALPRGSLVPRPRKLRLIIGKAQSFGSAEPGRESSHRISHELQQIVRELLCA